VRFVADSGGGRGFRGPVMSISIEEPFSKWKPSPKKDRNNWATLAVVCVVVAFVSGVLIGYALRDPAGQIEQLRLDAENAAKRSREATAAAAEARGDLVWFVTHLGLGITRAEAERRIVAALPDYRVEFTDSKLKNTVPTRVAEFSEGIIRVVGPKENVYSVTVIAYTNRNIHKTAEIMLACRLVADLEWDFDEAKEWFSKALSNTTKDVGTFAVRGANRIAVEATKDEAGDVLKVVYSAHQQL
jgi:hypothetical protein